MIKGKNMCLMVSTLIIFLSLLFSMRTIRAETIYEYNFESGWGNWYSDNGVWEIGVPQSGPNESHGGTQCAATVLSGDAPKNTNSRLISPPLRFHLSAAMKSYRFNFGIGFLFISQMVKELRYPFTIVHQAFGQTGKPLVVLLCRVQASGHTTG